MQNKTGASSVNTLSQRSLWNNRYSLHAPTIDCPREYLSAYTPAVSAPLRAPSSRTAAVKGMSISSRDRGVVCSEVDERTQDSLLKWSNRPSLHEILHDEHVRNLQQPYVVVSTTLSY